MKPTLLLQTPTMKRVFSRLQFIQTPDWSDVNFTATQIGPEERPNLENTAHFKGKVAPRSSSRFKVGESATKPITGINTEGTHVDGSSYPRDKRPSLSDSKASKSSDLPDLNKKHQPQQSSPSVLNDPKWCRDFSERLADVVDPADKKCHEAMTADELEDSLFIHLKIHFVLLRRYTVG
ncbi:uncharacterized protein LOC110891809 [Helianthus annuus]|uniref:uncharacterized protein LOC110891809 n=1 Tax=Helianthus annuus TaxID=4232 RepID=UPI000B907F1D|nr:uncharacterized protein LOC110891809 [Helianthus annuus]KAJ0516238.1 hypothetical protein HanHA89_Chr11g0411621 [Helianthus annuus]